MDHSVQNNPLFTSIRQLIEESKRQVLVAVNATMSMLYWKVGKQINEDILQNTGLAMVQWS